MFFNLFTCKYVNASRDHVFAPERHFKTLKHVNACNSKHAMGLLECDLHLRAFSKRAVTLGECNFALEACF